MAWSKEPCPACGEPKSSVSKNCRACYIARTNTSQCPSCGGKKTYESKMCRPCQGAASLAHHRCADCETVIQRGATRCIECYNRIRRSRPKKPCSVDGCKRDFRARGVCDSHYITLFAKRKPRLRPRDTAIKNLLCRWPCQVCNYNRMNSDIHRLIPGKDGGKYVPGNMVALCPRCHREVHRGITLPPVAPTEDEILSAESGRHTGTH